MDIRIYYEFEKCVAEIFEDAGYTIDTDVSLDECKADIVAVKDSKKYYIEVKGMYLSKEAANKIVFATDSCDAYPILVSSGVIEESKREQFIKSHPDLIIIDIANLLYSVQYNSRLRNKLVSVLPYSIDGIEPKKGFLESDTIKHHDYTRLLIEEMKLCLSGRAMAVKYEDICEKMLVNIFSDDLTLWRKQPQSNKSLYRFDLLCRIKDDNCKTFWRILERFFNSKYIVFEFKNYTKEITQKEIYSTEKYLYLKALRSVAIVISANGYDENSIWAAKGCLRENGKLIILLKTDDLIKMNEMKTQGEDPSDYLLEILDRLLLDLEK